MSIFNIGVSEAKILCVTLRPLWWAALVLWIKISDRRRPLGPAATSSNPVIRAEASLHRGPGGNPKSSLGGPRTAREVAGYCKTSHHQPVARRLPRLVFEARVGVRNRRRQALPAPCLVQRKAELPAAGAFPFPGRHPVPGRPPFRVSRIHRRRSLNSCCFRNPRSTKPGGLFGSPGFAGNSSLTMSEGYSVVLPEKGQTLASAPMPCAKQDMPVARRSVGRWLKVLVMCVSRDNSRDS